MLYIAAHAEETIMVIDDLTVIVLIKVAERALSNGCILLLVHEALHFRL